MTSAISFHVIWDAIDSDPNPLRMAIASLQPRVINIVGGARKTQAFSFAVELKSKYPNMRVIWRNWPDDGNHAKDRYKLVYHRDTFGNLIVDDYSGCQRWIDDNQNYLMAKLCVLTDNESMRDDLDVYAEWQARVMDLAGAKGWSVAVGRFATGNPPQALQTRLNSMYRTLFKWGDLHCYSPNEYFSKDPTRNGGNVRRYEDAINQAKSINAWPFPVNVGEYGLLYMDAGNRLDPEAGYHDSRVGLGSQQAARFCIENWKAWYKDYDVDVCLYCWGGDGTPKWERCRIDLDSLFIKELLDASAKGELEPLSKLQTKPFLTPMPKPSDATDAIRIRVTNTLGINLRSGASTDYQTAGSLEKGQEVTLFRKPFKQDGKGQVWRWVDIDEVLGGWCCSDVLQYVEVTPPVIVTPPPATPPPVSGKPAEVSADYARSMGACYRSLSDSYKLMATDAAKTSEQWFKLAETLEGKQAA